MYHHEYRDDVEININYKLIGLYYRPSSLNIGHIHYQVNHQQRYIAYRMQGRI